MDGVTAYLGTRGMRSVLPEFSPKQRTWRWETPLGELSQRLDHIAYDTSRLRPLAAHVIEAGRSDHFPVVATFTQRAAR